MDKEFIDKKWEQCETDLPGEYVRRLRVHIPAGWFIEIAVYKTWGGAPERIGVPQFVPDEPYRSAY